MARFLFFAVAVAVLYLASSSSALTPGECPTTCLPPYTKAHPSQDCVRMCNACLNATASGCTSYFLPYFYGDKYSKHFACWETCPIPTWAWAMIGSAIACMVLMTCCCFYCCYKRRQENRAAAMAIYQQQLSEQHPQMNARNPKVSFQQPVATAPAPKPSGSSKPQAPAPVPAAAATTGGFFGPKLNIPRPPSGLAKMNFVAAGFAMPSRSSRGAGGWTVTNPAYARLDDSEEPYSEQNPYARGGR